MNIDNQAMDTQEGKESKMLTRSRSKITNELVWLELNKFLISEHGCTASSPYQLILLYFVKENSKHAPFIQDICSLVPTLENRQSAELCFFLICACTTNINPGMM